MLGIQAEAWETASEAQEEAAGSTMDNVPVKHAPTSGQHHPVPIRGWSLTSSPLLPGLQCRVIMSELTACYVAASPGLPHVMVRMHTSMACHPNPWMLRMNQAWIDRLKQSIHQSLGTAMLDKMMS